MSLPTTSMKNYAPECSQVAQVYAQMLMKRQDKLPISPLNCEFMLTTQQMDPWREPFKPTGVPPGLEQMEPWSDKYPNINPCSLPCDEIARPQFLTPQRTNPRQPGRQLDIPQGVPSLQWLNEGHADEKPIVTESKNESELVWPPNATTLMICNIPCMIMPQQLVSAIDSFGFSHKYDLMYLPPQLCSDERKSANLGYGFVNFKTPADAINFHSCFTGYQFAGTCSKKVVSVRVARIQGFEANLKAASRALKHKKKTSHGDQIEYTSLTQNMHRVTRTEPLLLPTWDVPQLQ